MTEGSPIRLTKLWNACKNESAERASVSSKCTAQVDAQVNKQMNALMLSLDSVVTWNLTLSGPAKSTPVVVNGGPSPSLSGGRSGISEGEYSFPSNLRQMIQLRTTLFTASLPLESNEFL